MQAEGSRFFQKCVTNYRQFDESRKYLFFSLTTIKLQVIMSMSMSLPTHRLLLPKKFGKRIAENKSRVVCLHNRIQVVVG